MNLCGRGGHSGLQRSTDVAAGGTDEEGVVALAHLPGRLGFAEGSQVGCRHFQRYGNRAAQLLQEGKYNISEVADLCGFSTLSHFSASFKRQFGCTPSEYVRQ